MQTALETNRQGEQLRLPAWLGLCLFLAIAAFFLWEEHRAHILGAVPYALLLLCPIIHLLMHRGHGGHGASASGREDHDHDHRRRGAAS